jgi:hypothetical protein
VSGERLAARLEKVTMRLAADAPNMERTGADLVYASSMVIVYATRHRLPVPRLVFRVHSPLQAGDRSGQAG